MHKLDRTSVTPPACLDAYDYRTQKWKDLGSECKRELRAALVQMQGIPGVTTPDANEYGLRCAYCEGTIFHEGHIEHFRRKNPAHYPELTFAWPNLFLACGASSHCGHYKDRPGGQSTTLIISSSPMSMTLQTFFTFIPTAMCVFVVA